MAGTHRARAARAHGDVSPADPRQNEPLERMAAQSPAWRTPRRRGGRTPAVYGARRGSAAAAHAPGNTARDPHFRHRTAQPKRPDFQEPPDATCDASSGEAPRSRRRQRTALAQRRTQVFAGLAGAAAMDPGGMGFGFVGGAFSA